MERFQILSETDEIPGHRFEGVDMAVVSDHREVSDVSAEV
jgi:hypothetical protein